MDDRERYYTYREICELTTLSRTTIWRLRQSEGFPEGLRVSHGRVIWRARDVIAWIRHLSADWLRKPDPDTDPDPDPDPDTD